MRRACALALVGILGCKGNAERAAPKPTLEAVNVTPSANVSDLQARLRTLDVPGKEQEALAVATELAELMRAQKLEGHAYGEAVARRVELLFGSGKLQEAEITAKAALALPAGVIDDDGRITLLYLLGSAYAQQDRITYEATPTLREALALAEKTGTSPARLAELQQALASAIEHDGEFAEAEVLYRQVDKTLDATRTPEERGAAKVTLATNLESQERDDDAAALYRQALPLLENYTGAPRVALAGAHAGLGRIARRTDRLNEAVTAFRKALEIRTLALGTDHELVAVDMHNIAHALDLLGRTKEALVMCEQAVAITRVKLDADDPHRIGAEQLCANLRAGAKR